MCTRPLYCRRGYPPFFICPSSSVFVYLKFELGFLGKSSFFLVVPLLLVFVSRPEGSPTKGGPELAIKAPGVLSLLPMFQRLLGHTLTELTHFFASHPFFVPDALN